MINQIKIWFINNGIAVALFIMASLWTMYPILDHPSTEIIGWKGDNIQYVYMTGWAAHALTVGEDPLVDPDTNYPDPMPLATTDAPFLTMLLLAPITWLFGPAGGYNAVIGFSAFLSGLFMYLWIKQLTNNRMAGFISGLIYILTPYRIVHSYGHLQMISMQMFPLFFWSLDTISRKKEFSIKNVLYVGISIFLVGCMSQYYLVIALITGAIYYIIANFSSIGYHSSSQYSTKIVLVNQQKSPRKNLYWNIISVTGVIFVLVALSISYQSRIPSSIDIGGDDQAAIKEGFFPEEKVSDSTRTYRWTTNAATLTIPAAGSGSWSVSTDVQTTFPDASPVNAIISFGDNSKIDIPDKNTLRRIHMYVPHESITNDMIYLHFSSNTYREKSENPRDLGMIIFDATAQPLKANYFRVPPINFILLFTFSSLCIMLAIYFLNLSPVIGLVSAIIISFIIVLANRTRQGLLVVAPLCLYISILLVLGVLFVNRHSIRERARHTLWYGASIGVGVIFSALPYLLTQRTTGDYHSYAISETRLWSTSIQDFFIPSRLHPLWGNWVARVTPNNVLWIEHTAYLGIIPLIAAAMALFWKKSPYRKTINILILTTIAAFIFSLGTDLHFNWQALNDDTPFWLPMYYVAKLPVVSLMRAWSRFSVVVIVLTTALAGIGIAQLMQKLGTKRYWLALGCCIVVLIDLAPGNIAASEIIPRPIDQWIAQQPSTFAVAFLPVGYENFEAMIGAISHDKQFPGFNHQQHITPAFSQYIQFGGLFPAKESLQKLKEMKIRYVIINLKAYPVNSRIIIEQFLDKPSGGKVIDTIGDWVIFALDE